MKKLALISIILLLTAAMATSAGTTLSDYPSPFIKDGKLNALLVIGSQAKPIDNIAVTGIAMSLQTKIQGKVAVDAVVFDKDIKNISAQNLIVVGGPCVNTVAGELLGNKPDCTEGFKDGIGKIQLISTGNDHYALLVAGKWGEDTRRAGVAVARYDDFPLSGTEMEVLPTDTSKIEIN